MKRASICRVAFCLAVTLLIIWPAISRAQYTAEDEDQQNPNQYNDTWDGQTLKLVAYVLTPVGMILEWGIMRPLHHAATQTPAAPLLSGDARGMYLDRHDNAAKVPPGTFGPYAINPSNSTEPSEQPLPPVTAPAAESNLPPTEVQPAIPSEESGGQSTIR